MLLQCHFVGIGECQVASSLFHGRLYDFPFAAAIVDERLDYLTLFEYLPTGQIDRCSRHRVRSSRALLEEELLVEARPGLALAKNVVHCVLSLCDLCIEVYTIVIDHKPPLVAHVGLPQLFVYFD